MPLQNVSSNRQTTDARYCGPHRMLTNNIPCMQVIPIYSFHEELPFVQAIAALRRRTASVAALKFGISASPAKAMPSTNRVYSAS